jgi:hypothetical protein
MNGSPSHKNADARWVYRERWVADDRDVVDISKAMLTRITAANNPPVVFTQRSGSM